MNRLELTKPEKKIARQIIEKGLQKEYVDGILKLDNIISRWKVNQLNNRDAWMELYESLTKQDKHISGRYDYLSGSKYLHVIAAQLADRIIDQDDLLSFNDQLIINSILLLSGKKEI